jgi:dGTPase
LPVEWQSEFAHSPDDETIARVVCDYIAGMTDRFALQQYEQLLNS